MSYNNIEHFTINSDFFVNYKNYNNIGIKQHTDNNKGGGGDDGGMGHGSTVGYRPNGNGDDDGMGHGSTVG